MQGRRYSEGLHEAIEAKEGIKVRGESQTFATITIQNYFRLYPKLAGMTGTGADRGRRVLQDLQARSDAHPDPPADGPAGPPRPDLQDRDGPSSAPWWKRSRKMHEEGRPVLVGTVSIEKSEELARCWKSGHPALRAQRQAARARGEPSWPRPGQRGAVTIATNMAGRGTDITLGFGVAELGGLHIIGTERHESRRIDNQLARARRSPGRPRLVALLCLASKTRSCAAPASTRTSSTRSSSRACGTRSCPSSTNDLPRASSRRR